MDKDNIKARGLKHRTNKNKYKSNKTGAIPLAKTKSTASLESNWDRYELEEPEEKVNSSTDFSILANAPITHGSHFQFKSDKDIASEIAEPVNASSLFSLDLILLGKSLSTIPFNVRSSIEDCYFTESQRRIMTLLDDNVSDYTLYVEQLSKNSSPVFGSEVTLEDSTAFKDVAPEEEVEPDLGPQSNDDLEQWLDDVLDD